MNGHRVTSIVVVAALAALSLTISPATATAADDRTGSMEVGGFLGYNLYSDDIELGNSTNPNKRPGSAVLFGGRFGYNVTERIAAEGEFKYALSNFKDSGNPANVLGWRASALLHFQTTDVRPFALIGYGGETVLQEQIGTETDTDAALNVGAGLKYNFTREILLRFDLRYVNIAGSSDLTSDNLEVHLGVSYRIGGAPADSDQDGIPDDKDKCPNKAEDKDGFEDTDGCVDPDNDGDGILDGADKCREDAEDKDGFQDTDGCPDNDNDGDKIADKLDKCPNKAEDKDGFKDGDGCPDPDNDNDGIADTKDKCPNKFGVADEQGCPVKDQDKDGIPDKLDKCPKKPETFNGVKDKDGCPDGKQTVVITKTEIKILQKVYFALGKADIKSKSFTLLDTVAYVLNQHPRLTKVIVEGHTDDQGKAQFNKDLSQKRAESVVKYLVDKGMDINRLSAMGFGPDQPLCADIDELKKNKRKNKRKLKACREENRRVQFRIGEIDGKPVKGSDSVTIETKKIVEEKP